MARASPKGSPEAEMWNDRDVPYALVQPQILNTPAMQCHMGTLQFQETARYNYERNPNGWTHFTPNIQDVHPAMIHRSQSIPHLNNSDLYAYPPAGSYAVLNQQHIPSPPDQYRLAAQHRPISHSVSQLSNIHEVSFPHYGVPVCNPNHCSRRSMTDSKLTEMKEKMEKLQEDVSKWKHRCKQAEQYMKHLPTSDEFDETKKSLEEEEKKSKKLSDKNKNLEKMLANLKLQDRNKNEAIDRLTVKIGGLTNYHSDSDSSLRLSASEQLSDAKAENEQLAARLWKTEQELLKMEKHLKYYLKVSKETAQVKQRFKSLEAEISIKAEELAELKSKLNLLEEEKNDLQLEVLNLQEKLSSCSESSKERKETEQKLLREIVSCTFELGNIVEIVDDRLNDKDPDLSFLLTTEAFSSRNILSDLSALSSMKEKLQELKEINSKLRRVRTVISNKYAEDIANALQCSTH